MRRNSHIACRLAGRIIAVTPSGTTTVATQYGQLELSCEAVAGHLTERDPKNKEQKEFAVINGMRIKSFKKFYSSSTTPATSATVPVTVVTHPVTHAKQLWRLKVARKALQHALSELGNRKPKVRSLMVLPQLPSVPHLQHCLLSRRSGLVGQNEISEPKRGKRPWASPESDHDARVTHTASGTSLSMYLYLCFYESIAELTASDSDSHRRTEETFSGRVRERTSTPIPEPRTEQQSIAAFAAAAQWCASSRAS